MKKVLADMKEDDHLEDLDLYTESARRRISLRVVLPPTDGVTAPRNSPQPPFMDAELGLGTIGQGHDVDRDYEQVMEHAMQAYFTHRADDSRSKFAPPAPIKEAIVPVLSSEPGRESFEAWERMVRPPLSARFGRAVRVPPTVSMNEELNVLDRSLPFITRAPKRRPLTATRIRYPITGKMSQYPFVSSSGQHKSRSEQTTPVKIPKKPGGDSAAVNGAENGHAASPSSYCYGGGLFTKYGSKPRDFTIHPDWVSENVQIAKLTLTNRNLQSTQETFKYMTYPPRRCQSAPPPQYRNPITWQ